MIHAIQRGASKILLVGEAPNKTAFLGESEGAAALEIPRLADLCGITMDAFRGLFWRTNLLQEWPGRAEDGKGDLFPRALAVEGARRIKEDARTRKVFTKVVLLGRRTQDAFVDTRGRRPTEWFEEEGIVLPPCEASLKERDLSIVTTPHPSGTSSWWNDTANVKKARLFWEGLANEAISDVCEQGGISTTDPNPFLKEALAMSTALLGMPRFKKVYLLGAVAKNPAFDWMKASAVDRKLAEEDRLFEAPLEQRQTFYGENIFRAGVEATDRRFQVEFCDEESTNWKIALVDSKGKRHVFEQPTSVRIWLYGKTGSEGDLFKQAIQWIAERIKTS